MRIFAILHLILIPQLPMAQDSASEWDWEFIVRSGGHPLQVGYYVGDSEKSVLRVGCEPTPGVLRVEYSPTDPASSESRPSQLAVDGTVHPLVPSEGRSVARLNLDPELVAALVVAREVVIAGSGPELRFVGEATGPFGKVAQSCVAPRYNFHSSRRREAPTAQRP